MTDSDKRRQEERRRKRLEAAGIVADPRTAAGQRSYHVVGMGHSLRASVNHVASCLKRSDERTPARMLAWSLFDEHINRLRSSEVPSPSYEPGVDGARTPGVMEARLKVLRKDVSIREAIGPDYYDLLEAVIFRQHSFSSLAETPDEARALSYMFRRAIDLLAAHLRIAPDNKKGGAMGTALQAFTDRRDRRAGEAPTRGRGRIGGPST
jgi:hypothetical protein